jgi:hypothetical protein
MQPKEASLGVHWFEPIKIDLTEPADPDWGKVYDTSPQR